MPGGIGGNPIVGATPCPSCYLQSHASTGWCLAATGQPVVVITTINCNVGVVEPPVVQFINPVNGASIPLQPIVPCGDRDWEVNQLCDFDTNTGELIATFMQLFEWDETTQALNVTLVRADDPTIIYVPVGQVRACAEREPNWDIEWIMLCDDPETEGVQPIAFLRRLIYDQFNDTVTVDDFELDGLTSYVPQFTVNRCNSILLVDIEGSPNATVGRLVNINNAIEQCIPANPNRRQLILVAESGGSMYVKFGVGVSSTSYTVVIPSNGTYELQINQVYTGPVCFLKVSGGTNNVQYTEVFI